MRKNFGFRHLLAVLPTALFLSVLSFSVCAKFLAVSINEEDNYRNQIVKNIEAAVDRRGDDIYIDSAGGDFEYQYKQVKSYIQAGADAVIIIPGRDYKQNQRLVELSKQIPIVFINTEPVKEVTKLPHNSVYVGSNELESGTLQMEELAKMSGYKGKVALLKGTPQSHAARMRTLDVENVLAKYPKMTLVKTGVANFARNQAYKVVKQWIQDNVDFNILVANNDEMIVGGMMALRDAGKNVKSYLTGGIDATPDALNEMSQGNLNVTVLQDAVAQSRTAVDVAYKLIDKVPVNSVVWVPFRLVTPENLHQFSKK